MGKRARIERRLCGLGSIAALAIGCSERAAAPPAEAAAPSPASIAAVVDPTPDPPSASTDPEPASIAAPPTKVDPPAPPKGPPGFVLYTQDRTVVVPTDGSARREGEGLWIQDTRTAPPRLAHHVLLIGTRAERMGLPACPCAEPEGDCAYGARRTTRLDPVTLEITGDSDPACRCVHAPPSMGWLPPDPIEVDGVVYEPCAGDGETAPVSLVGGRLHHAGWEWNGACHGALSVYDAVSWTEDLVEPPAEVDLSAMRPWACTHDRFPAEIVLPWPLNDLSRCGSDTCSDCDDFVGEADVLVLRRGHLWNVEDQVGHAGGSRMASRMPARPDRCPSVDDPCGDPASFPKLRRSNPAYDYWVATDGSAALSAFMERYAIHRPGEAKPQRFRLPDIDAQIELLGVRHHQDLGPLLAVMDRHPALGTTSGDPVDVTTCALPRLAPEDEGFADARGGRGWGNRCFAHVLAERWDHAEAACRRGLEVATEDRARGALLYNLGRAAEGRGANERSAALYRESLDVRPGNKEVQRRLDALR